MTDYVLEEVECIESGSRFEWKPAATRAVVDGAVPYTSVFDEAASMCIARMLPPVDPPPGARFYFKGAWRPVDVTELVLAAKARGA